MLKKVDLITHLHQLLLLVIIHNGEDIMKQWDNNQIGFINMVKLLLKDYKENQEH